MKIIKPLILIIALVILGNLLPIFLGRIKKKKPENDETKEK